MFPIADGTVQFVWRDQVSRKIHINPGLPCTNAKSIAMIFKESRTGLDRERRSRMTVKPETIPGRSQGITFTVITLNQELSSTCRKKHHSQHHCDTLTLSGGRTQPWMCCRKAVLMIFGTMMTGAHRNLGLFHNIE